MNTNPLLDLLSHTALKGSAVLIVALFLGLVLRRTAAARRYALWITAIGALAVLPLAMGILPAWRVLPKAAANMGWPAPEEEQKSPKAVYLPVGPVDIEYSVPISGSEPQAPSPVEAPRSSSWNISWQDVVCALPQAWMIVSALLLLRLGWSAWRLRRLEATLRPGDSELLAQTADTLGLRRRPRLLIGPSDSVPMVWGVFRPRLLLPQGFEKWAAEKQRGVLLHELAHLKRGDPLALWTAQWVKALHWFNPLAWLTLRQLRADQERACDDTVLRHGVRASDYAQSLLDLSQHNRLAAGLSLCALTITRCAPVESRVKAILDPTRHREALTLRWLAGLGACALLITLPVAMLHAIEGPTLRGRILDRHGVVLAESTKEDTRRYPLKTLAAHPLGYVRIGKDKAHKQEGASSMELLREETLRTGNDVSLALDARIQGIAHRALMEASCNKAAAVVLDPRTGMILAWVSLPSYDPNVFIPEVDRKDWAAYVEDKDLPLFDRCLSKFSPPANGSIPLTALAGILAGAGDRTFECKPSTPSYQAQFECLDVRQGRLAHGVLGMESAVQCSCRHYWCQLGVAAGLDAFGKVGKWIGFGETYGVMDGESPGILPTQEWWEKHRHGVAAWREQDTANLAEGMGYLQATPLQMSVLAATVANNGRVPQPTLFPQSAPTWRADLVKEGLPSVQIQKLREGMRLAVNGAGGVGQGARSEKAVIAGSTGAFMLTSRDGAGTEKKKTHEWFIGFAPFENPVLAFAIYKEDGRSQGGDTAPVVKRIVEETLALAADGSGEVKPVEDDTGSAHEKLLQTQALFDAQSVEITQEVIQVLKPVGERLEVKKVTVARGRLIITGEAAELPIALGVMQRLHQIGKHWVIEWNFPVPRTLPEGKRVEFRAEGVCTAAAGKDEPAKPKAKVTSATDADIILDPQLADRWRLLKKKGHLADLPAKAVVVRPGDWTAATSPFQFTVTRGTAQLWLARSLGDAISMRYDKEQPWPEKPGAFDYTYEGLGDCMIQIKTRDAETVEVRLWLHTRGLKHKLIAPDEAAPSAPKAAGPQQTGEASEMKFDSAEISRQIKVIAKKTDVSLPQFKMSDGRVSIAATADDPDKARMFGDLLTQSGRQWGMVWRVTKPQQVPGRSVLMFMAVGYSRPVVMDFSLPIGAPSSLPAFTSSLRDWEVLQRFGKLAALPSGFTPDKVLPKERTIASMPHLMFAFTASRQAVHAWLSASLSRRMLEAEAEHLRDLGGTEPFSFEFWGQDNCRIKVEVVGDKARVLISRMNSLFKIAPDEFQKPRPAGKLAPEYKQEGFTQKTPSPLIWDNSLRSLSPLVALGEALPPREPGGGADTEDRMNAFRARSYWQRNPPAAEEVMRLPAFPRYEFGGNNLRNLWPLPTPPVMFWDWQKNAAPTDPLMVEDEADEVTNALLQQSRYRQIEKSLVVKAR